MAKLLPNRISEVMTDAQLKQFIAGIKMAFDAMPKKPPMPKEEFDKIPKKGEYRTKESNLKIKVVRRYTKFLPAVLSFEEMEKDNILHGQVNTLYDEHLQPLLDLADFILGLSGGEELNAFTRFLENVKAGIKDGDLDAVEASNELDAIDKQLIIGAYKKKTTETPTATPTDALKK